jgi:hypothetical protein
MNFERRSNKAVIHCSSMHYSVLLPQTSALAQGFASNGDDIHRALTVAAFNA